MKRLLNILVFVLLTKLASSQIYQPVSGYGFRWERGMFDSALHIPTGNGSPTLRSNQKKKSALFYDSTGKKLWVWSPKDSSWKLSGTDTAKFTSNITLNGPTGTRWGVWENGETIPLAGKTLDEFATIIAIKAVPPTYTAPTAGIGSSPSGGAYEIGTNLGTITLSATYTQNDGGTSTGNTFSKYISSWNNLASNTDAISSLTSTTYYRVTTTYNQGACKNNNLGVQDCTGRITAGSTTSGNIVFTPFQKRYWGFVNSSNPTDAEIRALTQDNNGSTVGLSLTNITPTGSQFLVYVRPNSGSVTSITVNGFPSTAAFTNTTRSFTNAQGHVSSYQVIISNNAQTSILNSVIFN